MHLTPMSLDDLNIHADSSHELSRDAMLEKIILLSVSYFCVGTELRFLSAPPASAKPSSGSTPAPEEDKKNEVPPGKKYEKKDSEMWHGKALELSSTLLPSECPLVGHVIMSYQKHHAPCSQAIPEDQPLLEELTVVRPLNEAKSDVVNYHQIVRSHSLPQKQKRAASKERNSDSARTQNTPKGSIVKREGNRFQENRNSTPGPAKESISGVELTPKKKISKPVS